MKLKITKTQIVERCADCMYLQETMDGPSCDKIMRLESKKPKGDVYKALVYPEGRDTIHDNCPFRRKNWNCKQ